MSNAARTTPTQHRPTRVGPVNREALPSHPTRKGREGALRFFEEIGVTGITPTRLRTATEDGSLRRFRVAGHNWYADRDLWDWLMSLASGGAA
ncbi:MULTISPECIES: hypothetical protein [unclassified Gordonia (in: high G+C Gram-positive bacteria)]|uniref:hypothetical protein n=1 Tax=unclassified Gordonia (in: high G+C Gram-positive bacteria) TaxID=2657482 RepID=UPI00111797C9|nr:MULTISPECIES: hypothetical protein [unclassified Gordonia (in: high G+C Gram-positive bacteria)]MCX2756595.1 hypothetical protein [Gordonia sp. 4N]